MRKVLVIIRLPNRFSGLKGQAQQVAEVIRKG